MTKPLMKTTLCLTAVLALLCAPTAFAGHGRDGWRHGGYRGHAEHYRGAVRYHDGWRHRYHRGHYEYDRDGIGHWVAGALVLGALTNLVLDATVPPPPPPVYRSTRVIIRDAPVERVYVDPYQTRYIGRQDDDDDGD